MAAFGGTSSFRERKIANNDPGVPSVPFNAAAAPVAPNQAPPQPVAKPVIAWSGSGGFQFVHDPASGVIQATSPEGETRNVSPGAPGYQEILTERQALTSGTAHVEQAPSVDGGGMYRPLGIANNSVVVPSTSGQVGAQAAGSSSTSTGAIAVGVVALIALLAGGYYAYSSGKLPKVPGFIGATA